MSCEKKKTKLNIFCVVGRKKTGKFAGNFLWANSCRAGVISKLSPAYTKSSIVIEYSPFYCLFRNIFLGVLYDCKKLKLYTNVKM